MWDFISQQNVSCPQVEYKLLTYPERWQKTWMTSQVAQYVLRSSVKTGDIWATSCKNTSWDLTKPTTHSNFASYSCPMRRLLFQNFMYSTVTSIHVVNIVIFATYSSHCATYFEKCGQRCHTKRRLGLVGTDNEMWSMQILSRVFAWSGSKNINIHFDYPMLAPKNVVACEWIGISSKNHLPESTDKCLCQKTLACRWTSLERLAC